MKSSMVKEIKILPSIQVSDIVLTIDKGIFGQVWLLEVTETLRKDWFRGCVVDVQYPEDEFWRTREFAMHRTDVEKIVNI